MPACNFRHDAPYEHQERNNVAEQGSKPPLIRCARNSINLRRPTVDDENLPRPTFTHSPRRSAVALVPRRLRVVLPVVLRPHLAPNYSPNRERQCRRVGLYASLWPCPPFRTCIAPRVVMAQSHAIPPTSTWVLMLQQVLQD